MRGDLWRKLNYDKPENNSDAQLLVQVSEFASVFIEASNIFVFQYFLQQTSQKV
jgi:hypothetical protein